jgi:hypothetical protein
MGATRPRQKRGRADQSGVAMGGVIRTSVDPRGRRIDTRSLGTKRNTSVPVAGREATSVAKIQRGAISCTPVERASR